MLTIDIDIFVFSSNIFLFIKMFFYNYINQCVAKNLIRIKFMILLTFFELDFITDPKRLQCLEFSFQVGHCLYGVCGVSGYASLTGCWISVGVSGS